jgi:hypothetical protein
LALEGDDALEFVLVRILGIEALDRRCRRKVVPCRHDGDADSFERVGQGRVLATLDGRLIPCGAATTPVHDDLELIAWVHCRRERRDERANRMRIPGDYAQTLGRHAGSDRPSDVSRRERILTVVGHHEPVLLAGDSGRYGGRTLRID